MPGHHVLFYDGVCGLCDRFVHFVLTRDRGRRFRYAPLQGRVAHDRLTALGFDPAALDTIYLVTADGVVMKKSRAVFFVLAQLGWGWRALATLRVLPRPLADRAYDLIARIRYRLFGKRDACPVPPPETRAFFLE